MFRYDSPQECPTILYAVNLWLKPVSATGARCDEERVRARCDGEVPGTGCDGEILRARHDGELGVIKSLV